MKFSVTFKKGLATVVSIEGFKEVDKGELSVKEMEDVLAVEKLLEKLTGFRCHVDQIK